MNRCRVVLMLGCLLLVGGCGVERTITVKTNPSGALVYLNDQEFGRTPVTREFTWYGSYDLVIRMDGYQTVKGVLPVRAPVWQWIPLDLVAELLPGLKDRHEYTFSLKPASEAAVSSEEMIERGNAMEAQLLSTRRREPTTSTTQPAPK